jgi:hypothetical protein
MRKLKKLTYDLSKFEIGCKRIRINAACIKDHEE